jgi:hypothetical protein
MNTSAETTKGSRTIRVLKWLLWGLRWLAIIVFGVMFCAGVFFALPWKILAFLAVIPLTGIFVPLRIQPWCWGVMTAVLIGVAVWLYVPRQDAGRWRTYRYDEDLAEVLVSRRFEGTLNAAVLYGQVLSTFDESIFDMGYYERQVEWQVFDDPWSAEDFPQLAEWMEPMEPAIEILLEAAAVDQCRFPIAHDTYALRTQLRRINQLKGWGRLLIRSANSDLKAGRHKAALDKQLAVLGMGRHLYQQQTLFDHSGGFFLELTAARALKRYAMEHANDPEELDRILAAMEKIEPNWPDAWDGIVATEKLMAKNIAALVYQVDDRGRMRIHRKAIASVGEGLGYSVPVFLQQELISRATTLALWLSVPISPESAGRLIDRRFEKFSELARRGTPAKTLPIQYVWRLGLNPSSAVDWLARHQMSFYSALDGQYKSHLALVRVTSLLVELKRYSMQHGRWPEHLAELEPRIGAKECVDPVSGSGFVYGITETGFYLYSIGRNAVDDRGLNNPKENLDDIVFWPLEIPKSGF